jgi:hypothetical protein
MMSLVGGRQGPRRPLAPGSGGGPPPASMSKQRIDRANGLIAPKTASSRQSRQAPCAHPRQLRPSRRKPRPNRSTGPRLLRGFPKGAIARGRAALPCAAPSPPAGPLGGGRQGPRRPLAPGSGGGPPPASSSQERMTYNTSLSITNMITDVQPHNQATRQGAAHQEQRTQRQKEQPPRRPDPRQRPKSAKRQGAKGPRSGSRACPRRSAAHPGGTRSPGPARRGAQP